MLEGQGRSVHDSKHERHHRRVSTDLGKEEQEGPRSRYFIPQAFRADQIIPESHEHLPVETIPVSDI